MRRMNFERNTGPAMFGRFLYLLAAALVCGTIDTGRAAEAPLVLERTIPLPDVSGRIDHMAIDLKRGRLFIAELGNGTVDVIDLASGRSVRRIRGLHEPQGIGYAPTTDVMAVANAGDGSVRLFKGDDLAAAGRADLGDDADNIRFDTKSRRFLVGFGKGGIATIDPANGQILARITLPAHPEGFQIDPDIGRGYINLPDAHQIAVVDLAAGRQVGTWHVSGVDGNFPMAFDGPNHQVAAVYRSPPRLVLMDAATGKVIGAVDTCGDADDLFFDLRRQRIYVSCGAGSIDTFERVGGTYRLLARTPSGSGARTSLFEPTLDRLFVARRAGLLGSEAALLVFRAVP